MTTATRSRKGAAASHAAARAAPRVASRDYVKIAVDYAHDVVDGRILACKWTKAACQRHIDDLARADSGDAGAFPCRFDATKAVKPCRFVELLPHIKGKWARNHELITLSPWQVFVTVAVFGWVNAETGKRRFRSVYIEVPRKNGKSSWTSGIALYMLTADGEEGAEVYSAATTRDQAKIVFSAAQTMARRSPALKEATGVDVGAHNINVVATASKFEALSAEGETLDGLNTHFGAIDELHAHKKRDVLDVIETSMGSREQPLLWMITTAGSDRAGICYEQRTYVTKILNTVLMQHDGLGYKVEGASATDDSYFGAIYTLDDGDAWDDPTVWAKANPNLGVSVFPDYIASLCRKAQETPSAVNNFLTKHLDQWVNADVAWMDMRAWDKCADANLTDAQFEHQECVLAFDLASKIDLAARMQLFERDIEGRKHYYAFGRYYLPDLAVEESNNSQYEGWVRENRIETTEGNIIDFDVIEDEAVELVSRFTVREVAYDPFQATQFSTQMAAKGFAMVEMRPTVLNFSEPMKQLEALVLDGRFHHDGDPILSWAVSNVVCHYDKKDNIYPTKERNENKIDPLVALLMALGRVITAPIAVSSVYEERGILSF